MKPETVRVFLLNLFGAFVLIFVAIALAVAIGIGLILLVERPPTGSTCALAIIFLAVLAYTIRSIRK